MNQHRPMDSCMQKRINLLSTSTTTLEPESQTDLLCFLVATVAASYSLTSEWRVDHVVESCRIWLARNRIAIPWLERVKLGQLALQIARRDLHTAGIAIRQSNVQTLFTDEMGINTASTLVQRISAVCETALRERPAI
jgi:hypothetical protein